jgi:hypothetical protein
VSTLAIVLASLADRAPSAEVVATFDAVHRRVAGSRT